VIGGHDILSSPAPRSTQDTATEEEQQHAAGSMVVVVVVVGENNNKYMNDDVFWSRLQLSVRQILQGEASKGKGIMQVVLMFWPKRPPLCVTVVSPTVL
jgi:hypothetical protein